MSRPLPAAVFLLVALVTHAQTPAPGQSGTPNPESRIPSPGFSVVEASIDDMRLAMEQGRTTSRDIVSQSLVRIATYEDRLNAAITINPRALAEADERDRERKAGRVRGRLHGIPVALKDNIHTTDMPTTGGALVFAQLIPPYEATLTRNLREAGAIIIAKTVLTELANWVADRMPTNYSSLAGFGFNPYDPRRDPRDGADGRPVLATGGSSSGIGTAASFWAANVGTETSGSILSPSNQTMLAGIKPTVGRISRYGVIPIAAEQDTPGPMARSVTDAAILLGALESAVPDPNDAATKTCAAPDRRDYTRFLQRDGLKGARIGIPRAYYYDAVAMPGERGSNGGLNNAQRAVMQEAISILRAQGATVIDPSDIPSVVTKDPARSLLMWPVCSGPGDARGRDEDCSVVFKYGMKRDFNAWLASLGERAPVKSLEELRVWNRTHEAAGALKYGQAQLDISDEMNVESDRARYQADRARDVALGGRDGIDAALTANRLDALLFPGSAGAAIAAKPGYPDRDRSIRHGAEHRRRLPVSTPGPAPYGVSFTGTACSEGRLIELAYAFEQATRRRVPPRLDWSNMTDKSKWESLVAGAGCPLDAPRPPSNDHWDLVGQLTVSSLYLTEEPDVSRAVPAHFRRAPRRASRSAVTSGMDIARSRSVHRAAGSGARRRSPITSTSSRSATSCRTCTGTSFRATSATRCGAPRCGRFRSTRCRTRGCQTRSALSLLAQLQKGAGRSRHRHDRRWSDSALGGCQSRARNRSRLTALPRSVTRENWQARPASTCSIRCGPRPAWARSTDRIPTSPFARASSMTALLRAVRESSIDQVVDPCGRHGRACIPPRMAGRCATVRSRSRRRVHPQGGGTRAHGCDAAVRAPRSAAGPGAALGVRSRRRGFRSDEEGGVSCRRLALLPRRSGGDVAVRRASRRSRRRAAGLAWTR